MDGYILDLRKKYGHLSPKEPQYSLHKHRPIDYGAKQQIVQSTDTIPYLDDKLIKRVQGIVGSLLYLVIAVNNKLLVVLSSIGAHQTASTKETENGIEQLIDCVATYPDDWYHFSKK